MTPKEKAAELFDKFRVAIWKNGNPNHINDHAKECALIFADEILSLRMIGNMGRGIDLTMNEKEYRQQVKEEIQKL